VLDFANITTWLLSHGVSEMVLKLIIAMSLVATIVSIARYIVGTKSYGIYAPVLLAIAYSYTGLKYGLVITTVVIITTLLSYRVLRRIRMHYITRIATNYTLLSIFLILFFVIVDRFGLGLENLKNIPPLAFISIVALSDFFVKQYVKKSLLSSLTILISTVAVATMGWFIITRGIINNYLINNLWILPALTLLNILLGQYKGLRIKDYFRFRITKDDTSK
jgi:hypothetical protein